MRLLLCLFLLGGLLALQSCTSAGGSDIRVLPPAEFKSELAASPNAYLLDVRTPEEFAAGHLDNALNLNYNAPDFKTQVSQLDRTRPVFLYCAVGGRSSKASLVLKELGFPQITDLKGGYNGWPR